jgi:N-acetylglucosaminyldiphosphoundecaprenol N-acetyl-beta-D-mannosaminyltransferase
LSTNPLHIPKVRIADLPIAIIDCARSADWMVKAALGRRPDTPPLVITSANGQVISMCARDPEVRKLFLAADLIHADGMPLVLASRLKHRNPLPERVATTDLFHDVARVAQARGATFYFLGATQKVIEAAVSKVRADYPGLRIVGYGNGYFGQESLGELAQKIDMLRPDILWIGMGVPREIAIALALRPLLTNVGVIKTSGGLFDFLSGKNRRAPQWMQSAGLEWFYRLMLEPRRLFLRYLTTNPHAFFLLLRERSHSSKLLRPRWHLRRD